MPDLQPALLLPLHSAPLQQPILLENTLVETRPLCCRDLIASVLIVPISSSLSLPLSSPCILMLCRLLFCSLSSWAPSGAWWPHPHVHEKNYHLGSEGCSCLGSPAQNSAGHLHQVISQDIRVSRAVHAARPELCSTPSLPMRVAPPAT